MTVTLGHEPERMSLLLVEDADFVCTLRNGDGPWSSGIVVAIEVAGTVWTATIVGDEARFAVDKVAVNAAIATIGATAASFRLTYTEGSTDLVWGQGSVKVKRA